MANPPSAPVGLSAAIAFRSPAPGPPPRPPRPRSRRPGAHEVTLHAVAVLVPHRARDARARPQRDEHGLGALIGDLDGVHALRGVARLLQHERVLADRDALDRESAVGPALRLRAGAGAPETREVHDGAGRAAAEIHGRIELDLDVRERLVVEVLHDARDRRAALQDDVDAGLRPAGREREARDRRALEVGVAHEEPLVVAGREARRRERTVGPRAERGDLGAEAQHAPESREGVLAPARERAARRRDRRSVLVHDPARQRRAGCERDVELPRLARREREGRVDPRHVARLVHREAVRLGRNALQRVRPVRRRAHEPCEGAPLEEELGARDRPARPVLDDPSGHGRRRGERDGQRTALRERQLHVRSGGPARVSGVHDEHAAPVRRVRDPEGALGVRDDPARRRLDTLESYERALDRALFRIVDDAGDRTAGRDGNRPREPTGAHARRERGREPFLAHRDAVARRARLLESEDAVRPGHDGARERPESRIAGTAAASRLEDDLRSRERRAGRVDGGPRDLLGPRQEVLAEVVGLGRVVDVFEENRDDARPLGPDAEESLLARLGRHRQREGSVGPRRRRRERLRRLAALRLAPRLVAGRLPCDRGDGHAGGGAVAPIRHEEPAPDLAGVGGEREVEQQDGRETGATERFHGGTSTSN